MATPLEKAEAIVAAWNDNDREFAIPGTDLSVSVARAPQVRGDDLYIWLTVSRAGQPLNVQNPFIFHNPPLRFFGDVVDKPRLAFLRVLRDAIVEASRCRP